MREIIERLEERSHFILASELSRIEDEKLFMTFLKDWEKVAAVYAKMSTKQREKISRSLKKYWKKAKKGVKKAKESKLAELIKRGVGGADLLYLMSLMGL